MSPGAISTSMPVADKPSASVKPMRDRDLQVARMRIAPCQRGIDFFENLSVELIQIIFHLLPSRDFLNLKLASRVCASVPVDTIFWISRFWTCNDFRHVFEARDTKSKIDWEQASRAFERTCNALPPIRDPKNGMVIAKTSLWCFYAIEELSVFREMAAVPEPIEEGFEEKAYHLYVGDSAQGGRFMRWWNQIFKRWPKACRESRKPVS